MLADKRPAPIQTQLHNRPKELGLRDDLRADIGLLDMVDEGRRRHARRVMDGNHLALGRVDVV